MEEPVIDPASVLAALATPHRGCFARETVPARATVLTAGAGNERLLAEFAQSHTMQTRPLRMVLLRGPLPALYGHCVVGGKPVLTITTVPLPGGRAVWQVGGEIAECDPAEAEMDAFRRRAAAEIRRLLPSLDLAGVEIATYRAVRAEGRTADLRRPSGVQVSRVAPRVWVAWPTKLALAPILAEEVFQEVTREIGSPSGYNPGPIAGDPPPVATPPWEVASTEWFPMP